MSRKWAYMPGELAMRKILDNMRIPGTSLTDKFLDLTEEYSRASGSRRTMILNDNKEVVFFVQLDEYTLSTKRVDVYVWDGDEYQPLSAEQAKKVSQTYFDYVDAMSEAYGTLDGEEL